SGKYTAPPRAQATPVHLESCVPPAQLPPNRLRHPLRGILPSIAVGSPADRLRLRNDTTHIRPRPPSTRRANATYAHGTHLPRPPQASVPTPTTPRHAQYLASTSHLPAPIASAPHARPLHPRSLLAPSGFPRARARPSLPRLHLALGLLRPRHAVP